jgi:hypothetical protein
MRRVLLVVMLVCLFGNPAHAGLKTIGKGDKLQLDPAAFPNNMKERYLLMKFKCAKCHTLERAVVALQTGIAPISGQPFDRDATRAYGIKMMRKSGSNMSKPEIKEIIELLNFLLDEAAK